ncbi:hypothetical protein RFI_30377 [Reticulomyxa filosa]|uniref:Uncharacterized protein n=1 Tax=Reticulomyxa filosa TaxID=46433 RepID=X6M204_RETFI|nr:hypothetical protein RFI_30377 [Reticulomyxa filosa]|eukprot:ETO07015.1 hypothetical protein RFI_30377 [Reticulomyxa filosa]
MFFVLSFICSNPQKISFLFHIASSTDHLQGEREGVEPEELPEIGAKDDESTSHAMRTDDITDPGPNSFSTDLSDIAETDQEENDNMYEHQENNQTTDGHNELTSNHNEHQEKPTDGN